MPGSRRAVGDEAEDRAAAYLLGLGYTLITRHYTVRGGEIDLVAMDADTLVFVEVKYRRADRPEDALTTRKSSRMRVAARAYLRAMAAESLPHRFDLIAIEGDSLRHHLSVELADAITIEADWQPDENGP